MSGPATSCELMTGPNLQQMDWIMSQAATTLSRPTSAIETLFKTYQAAVAEKRRMYALADDTDDDATEAGCAAAYSAAENIADALLAAPVTSDVDRALKARVLLARGADPADLFYYRPADLIRFIQEISGLAQL